MVSPEVLRLIKNRDPEFLKKLFHEVNPYLSRICMANGITQEHISELIHQTWEQFFSNLEKFEGRSQVRTFICGILFNKIREHRRLQKRFVYEEDSSQFMNEAFSKEGYWRIDPMDPQALLESRQLVDFVKECMEVLSDQQMSVFLMQEVEEEKSEDICNVLGLTLSNLRVLLFRAKDKLRKCVDGKVGA